MGLEAEIVTGARYIQLAAWLSVRFASVEVQLTSEASEIRDQCNQITNGNLGARSQVDWLRIVVAFRSQHDPFCRVLHVQEFSRRAAVAPDFNRLVAALSRLHALLDQRRDNVRRGRIEVIARSVEIGWQQKQAIEAVFLAVSLTLHQQHFLSQPVRGVGFLWVATPDVLLT